MLCSRGFHYGTWIKGTGIPPWTAKSDQKYNVFGVDSTVDLEYNFYRTNFYFGSYWKSAVNFQKLSGFWGDTVAFILRYSL